MSAQRYFIQLSYKGTHYFGWQIQPGHISVQEVIERALTQLNSNEKIAITGCGRTDTGVHASMYFAHFDASKKFDPDQLRYKLNLMLPADIAVQQVWLVGPDLHARFSAISRTYEYHIHRKKDPFLAEFSWLNNMVPDLEKMNAAGELLKKHTHLECFSKVNTDVKTFDCIIYEAFWSKDKDGYCFTISANRFLRNMVRAIVGTMIDIGLNKMSMEEFKKILESGNRSEAGVSVPACGLILTRVRYPDGIF